MDFCEHAPIVQERVDPIDLVAGQAEYDIDTATGTDVTLILEAACNGRLMECLKTGDRSLSSCDVPAGVPRGYRQCGENLLTLDFAPQFNSEKALTLVATKPKRTASTVADLLLDNYGYEIGMGVVGRLLMIPGQKFSSSGGAYAYTKPYLTARTNARIRADMSFGSGESRVRPRSFL